MANASLSGIYDRLNNTSSYHPFSANTFNDWSLEAGDVVTVKSGDKSYSSPVFNNNVSWKGTAESTLNTSGNQTRDSISKVSQQKYSSSASGITNGQGLYGDVWGYNGLHSQIMQTESNIYAYVEDIYQGLKSGIDITSSSLKLYVNSYYDGLSSRLEMTASSIRTTVNDNYSGLRSMVEQTASSIRTTVNNNYSGLSSMVEQTASSIRTTINNNYSGLSSGIRQTDSSIRTYVRDRYNNLRSGIEQTASSFALYIEGVSDSTGKVTAASISAAINAQEGTSTVKISADKINVGASGANVSLSNVLSVLSSGDVTITGDVYSTGTFHPNGISMAAGSTLSFAFGTSPPATYTFNSSNVPNMIVNAEVDNSTNTLTLTKMNGDEVTFRKAAAAVMTGAWGSGTVTVTCAQSTWYSTIREHGNTLQWAGGRTDKGYIDVQAYTNGAEISDSTGATIEVDLTDVYDQGWNDALEDAPDAVAAYEQGKKDALVTGVWRNGTLTASNRSNSNNTWTTALRQTGYTVTWSGTNNAQGAIAVEAFNSGAEVSTSTGAVISFSASGVYTNGYRAGSQAVTIGSTVSWTTNPSSTISAGTNSLQLTTSGRVNSSGAASEVTKTVSLYMQDPTDWDNSHKCYVYATHTSSANSNRIMRKQVDASGVYSAGQTNGRDGVRIGKTAWDGGYVTFSKSTLTSDPTVHMVHLVTGKTTSGNTVTVKVYDGSVSNANYTGCYADVDLGESFEDGKKAATVSGKWSGGTVTAWNQANSNRTWTSTIKTNGAYTATWAADMTTGSVSIQAYNSGSETPDNTGATIQFNALPAVYYGKSTVGLIATPTWSNTSTTLNATNTVTITTTGRTNSSGTDSQTSRNVALYLTQDSSFSSNKKKVYMRQGGTTGTIRAQVEVDATSVRYAGKADVGIGSASWESYSGDIPTYRTVSVSTTGRTNSSGTAANLTTDIDLYLTQAENFSSHKKYVSCRTGSVNGTVRLRLQVDATTEYDSGYDKGYTKGLEAYYKSGFWNHNATTGVVSIPNKTNTASETWFTYNVSGGGSSTTHSPTVTNWGEMSKTGVPSSVLDNFISGRTRAHAKLQVGYYYIFQAKCGNNTKSYFIET